MHRTEPQTGVQHYGSAAEKSHTYDYRGVSMMRYGWWVSAVVFNLLVLFTCRWCSKLIIDDISAPLESVTRRGARAKPTLHHARKS